MKQVLTSAKTGALTLADVPPPALLPGTVRVRTAASLLSAGTERMILDLASKSYLGKAQARPDLVRQVLDKARKEGLMNTWQNVQSKLDKPLPLGYSAAGVVEAVAPDTGFSVGDRVAVAGAGFANHAEIVVVPKNLVARIPDGVAFEDAAYATVAAIALQGVRLARPELGDTVVVVGLGLIGLVTVQLLKANGCRVYGTDPDAAKLALARTLGLDDGTSAGDAEAVRGVEAFTRGRGADHTLITAATDSNGPITLAGDVTRRKGNVVAVGAVGLDVPRTVYFQKEITLQISMSYGPGRYDASYEEGGVDYPYDYVRWTEQRNLEAVLDQMAAGTLDVAALTTHRFAIDDALAAYELVRGREPYVGIVLTYDTERPLAARTDLRPASAPRAGSPAATLAVGFVGAGNYASVQLLPHLAKRSDVRLTGLVTATGPSAAQKGDTFGFGFVTTEVDELIHDAATDAVFVATRHSTHADFTAKALRAGKHVFVEKPLVVTEAQLADVSAAYAAANAVRPTGLMVGVNRRFSPHVRAVRDALEGAGPKQMTYRVNSGAIPPTTWLHTAEEGGGMLVGEACHFVDVMRFLAGERAVEVYARALALDTTRLAAHDNVTIVVTYDGGSVGTLAYSTVGDKAGPKERLEVFAGGRAALLDDFRRLDLFANGTRRRLRASNQDKGQATQVAETVEAFRASGQAPIPFEEVVEAMQVVFAAQRSLASGLPERVGAGAEASGDGLAATPAEVTV